MSIKIIEDPGADDPSAAAWIRAYPRRAMVGPGETRTVRLLAQPPADLPDGEYWARAVVSSRGAQVPLESPDSGGVRVGLTLEVRTVVPVTYRKGDVSTAAVITNLDQRVAGDSLLALVGMRRTGNAAFLGTLHLALQNSSGALVVQADRHVAVYRDLLKRVVLPVGDLPSGNYTLHVRLDTERSDLDPKLVLPAPAQETSAPVKLP